MVVKDPELHDGTLCSIELTEPSGLVLQCVTDDGKAVRIVGEGLVRLHANELRERNIIFEVRIGGADDYTQTALARLFFEHPGGTQKGRDVIAAGGCLLEIESSYGCELVALFSGPVTLRSA